MDGEHRLNAAVFLNLPIENVEVYRRHGGLPVIAVQDVRFKIDILDHFADRFREEREPLRVVIEPIDAAVALEIILIVDEVIFDAVITGLKHAAVLVAPAKRHIKIAKELHLFAPFRFNRAVERHNHPAGMLPAADCARQRTRHVRKASGRDKRRRFACYV